MRTKTYYYLFFLFISGAKHEMPYTTRTITNAGQILKTYHVLVLEIQLVSVRRGDVDGFPLHIFLLVFVGGFDYVARDRLTHNKNS